MGLSREGPRQVVSHQKLRIGHDAGDKNGTLSLVSVIEENRGALKWHGLQGSPSACPGMSRK